MLDNYWKTILTEKKLEYTKTVQEHQESINAYVKFDPDDTALHQAKDKYYKTENANHDLNGIPFAIKNNIAVEGNKLTCASELLRNYVTPVTANAVKQLLQTGLLPVGLTNMDEFAMGSDSSNTIFGAVKNPWDITRTAGGSSGGSASAVAGGTVPFALGSDTGGSVRQPASFCGQWGLKPTYGSVSRYGLVAFASSLDVIGIICEHPKWLSPVFETMRVKGKDPQDASAYYPDTLPSAETKKIGMFIPNNTSDSSVKESLELAKKQYERAGYEIGLIDLPMVEYSSAVYINIAAAEASTNLARFDGIRYGNRGGFADNRLELIRNARNNGFGDEVKLRVLMGGFVLRSGFQDQYYLKAQKIRAQMKKTITSFFEKYDLIITPVTTSPAFKLGSEGLDSFQQKLADAYCVIANLSGVPSISIPVLWKDNLPLGIQVMAPHYAEERLFKFVNDSYDLFEYDQSPYAKTLFEKTGRDISRGIQ